MDIVRKKNNAHERRYTSVPVDRAGARQHTHSGDEIIFDDAYEQPIPEARAYTTTTKQSHVKIQPKTRAEYEKRIRDHKEKQIRDAHEKAQEQHTAQERIRSERERQKTLLARKREDEVRKQEEIRALRHEKELAKEQERQQKKEYFERLTRERMEHRQESMITAHVPIVEDVEQEVVVAEKFTTEELVPIEVVKHTVQEQEEPCAVEERGEQEEERVERVFVQFDVDEQPSEEKRQKQDDQKDQYVDQQIETYPIGTSSDFFGEESSPDYLKGLDQHNQTFFDEETSVVVTKLPELKDKTSLKEFSQRTYAKADVARQIFSWKSASFRFASVCVIASSMLGSLLFVGHALATKDRVEQSAQSAIASLKDAASSAKSGDLATAYTDVDRAHEFFAQAERDITSINSLVISLSRYVPIASKLSSGNALVQASVHLSAGMQDMAELTRVMSTYQKVASAGGLEDFSILEVSETFFTQAQSLHEHLTSAKAHIDTVHVEDVPEEQREEFIALSRFIGPINDVLGETISLEPAISEILGSNGPRTYLFLFENNQEMRASGGFIGSYGFLSMNGGHVREFKIDGIYNPDGQLTDKVVPPRPIQKISAAWSLHDSNWWPHFPKSAEKAMDFYARTGGPSVDGVIAVTPVMVEKLLGLTGPITLPEYDVTLTADNFIELTQYKVEVDFDKEENRPKKILSDLMPALIEEIGKDLSQKKVVALGNIIISGLSERQIMIYMRNEDMQSIIEDKHWGGRLLEADDDYLSVVHSNINGFKTDGVIDEEIEHEVEFHHDGRIVNTVTVTRTHNGGDTGREWWDAVNADYMRVYVPEGSRLLSATGHTREWHEPRLDYDALGFEVDKDVASEEDSAYVDPETGTRIYTDTGKTVFGNWVYVSPQETVRVTYVYELPWRFVTDSDDDGRFGSYSALYQKQAGAQNVDISTTMKVPDGMEVIASVPGLQGGDRAEVVQYRKEPFRGDVYRGMVFRIRE